MLDGKVIVNMMHPTGFTTLKDSVICRRSSEKGWVERVWIDNCKEHRLKVLTKTQQVKGVKQMVADYLCRPKNWHEYLSENKNLSFHAMHTLYWIWNHAKTD